MFGYVRRTASYTSADVGWLCSDRTASSTSARCMVLREGAVDAPFFVAVAIANSLSLLITIVI